MKTKNSPFYILSVLFVWALIALAVYGGYRLYYKFIEENKILKEIITRLEADSRVAEVVVTGVRPDPATGKNLTTIKFLEYESTGKPLTPQYFTFHGNIIQFQSLVVRFDDRYIRHGDALKGKSVYVFWKVFFLDGPHTEEFEINKADSIPDGYKIEGPASPFERDFWAEFWKLAFDSKLAAKRGVKNAQIEAPGSKFIPGMIYTLKIEHHGGIRIDAAPIPQILKGEKVLP